ncbi:zinc-ribbon domain-containing protein [Microlunatus lacustris]
MLIFGLSSKQVLLATLYYVCEVCGNQAAHQLVKHLRRFTLFFIPIFPVGTRYADTCTFCARTIDVPRDRAEAAVAGQSGQGSAELR